MWLPSAIVKVLDMFRPSPQTSQSIRYGGSDLEPAPIVGTLRPDAVGDGERHLPGFYIRNEFDAATDSTPPWGLGGAPLTARGNVLHDGSGAPLV